MRNLNNDRWFCNKAHKKVFGVCAGFASFYQQPVWVMRLLAIVLFLMLPTAVLVGYLAAAFFLPDRYVV